jgi:hypothetical protein
MFFSITKPAASVVSAGFKEKENKRITIRNATKGLFQKKMEEGDIVSALDSVQAFLGKEGRVLFIKRVRTSPMRPYETNMITNDFRLRFDDGNARCGCATIGIDSNRGCRVSTYDQCCERDLEISRDCEVKWLMKILNVTATRRLPNFQDALRNIVNEPALILVLYSFFNEWNGCCINSSYRRDSSGNKEITEVYEWLPALA